MTCLVEWDPYTYAILTEVGGTIQFKDLVDGVTMQEEVDEVTSLSRWVVIESQDEKRQPQIVIKSSDKHKTVKKYLMPSRAHLMVGDGDEVSSWRYSGQDPARNHQDQGYYGRTAARRGIV